MFSTARRRVLARMAGGLVVTSIPVTAWWVHARRQRAQRAEEVRTQIRIPGSQDVLDQIIEDRCQPGDVVLFDRRCETCAASPWAALLLIVPQFRIRIQTLTMKLSAIVALLAVSGASAYSTPSRNDLRSLGQKSFSTSSGPRKVEASMKMEGV